MWLVQSDALGVVTGTIIWSIPDISVFMRGPTHWCKEVSFYSISVLYREKKIGLFDTWKYFAMFSLPSGQNDRLMDILLILK